MRADVGLPVRYVKVGVPQQLHEVAVVLAEAVVQTARGVEARLDQLGVPAEAVDQRDVVLVGAQHGVDVPEEALVVLALPRRAALDGLEHAVANEGAREDDDRAKAVRAQKPVDQGRVRPDRDAGQGGVLALGGQREEAPREVDQLLADELAVPLVDLRLVEVEPVLPGRHDEGDVARLGRLHHVGAVDPVDVLAEEPVQQVDRAIRPATLLRQLVAVHLVGGDDDREHHVALKVVGVEVDSEQCHSRPPLGRAATLPYRSQPSASGSAAFQKSQSCPPFIS